MQLRRRIPSPRLISLVSMVDVLLIMLVFFMVTSTYLNLDMIPMTQSAGGPAAGL
jgi:biopolymer transport protein ExbD